MPDDVNIRNERTLNRNKEMGTSQNSSDIKTRRKRLPHFLLAPRNKVVDEGDNVRFLCSFTGFPEPSLTWQKDNDHLLLGERATLVQTESLYILQINSVVPEDGGNYILVLENELGKVEASAHLEVKAKNSSCAASSPTILRPLTDITAKDEQSCALTCEVAGSPTPSVRWYKDETAISQCQDFKLLYDGHTASLIISEIYPEDRGIYKCIAKNAYGEVETACRLTVIEGDEEESNGVPPFFSLLLQDREVTDGDKVTFTVQVKGTQPLEIIWVHNDKEIKDCRDFHYVAHEDGSTFSLVIEDVFIEDSGLYVCEAYNMYGDAETLCKLSVKERFPTKCNERSQNVSEKKKVTVENIAIKSCDVEHTAQEIPTTAKETSRFQQEDTKIEDATNCTCNKKTTPHRTESVKLRQRPPIENGEAKLETECFPPKESQKLIPARILRGPFSLAVLQGESVKLKVKFVGYPIPSITWLKGGKIVCNRENVKIINNEESSILCINKAVVDDSGKYVVTAENSAGSDCGFASVSVEGPPDPPRGQPNVSDVTNHSLVLSWYGAMFDGGSIVTGYLIEMLTFPDGKWEKISVCNSTCFVVNRLTPGNKYRFRVRTENAHGLSKPSKETDIICIPIENAEETEDFEVFEHRIVNIDSGIHFIATYDLKEEVGRGRFGTVYRCVEKVTGEERAAKIVKCLKAKDKSKVLEEIDIMNRLRHPKLLQLAAAYENPRDMVLVLEYISGGELFERIIADDFVLTENDCILFMRQICEGVKYMHQNHVIHLDLKPENILCKTKTSHQIKIIDFGLARVYDASDNLRILFGTPEFVAPEVIGYEPVSPASDMWSIGVICYVLLSGLSPFMGDNDAETFTNITRSQFDFDDEAFDAISNDAKDFIINLLVKRPEKRMTASSCLKHIWLAEDLTKQKTVQLSTDKLKKFIIRRKWQKSGNAIRALGRMVSLSGSRSSLGSFSSISSFGERSDSETSSPTLSSMNRFSNQEPIQEYLEGLNGDKNQIT